MSRKTDPRVLRTRRWLRNALIELITEKGYEQVLVQDITERAELNRATFYLHYGDKDELLTDCANVLFADMMERKGITPESPVTQLQSIVIDAGQFLPLLEHFAEYADFYQVVLGENGVPAFATTVRKHYGEEFEQGLTALKPETDPMMLKIIAQFAAAGVFGLLTWWLHNAREQSPEQVAKYLADIMKRTLVDFVDDDM